MTDRHTLDARGVDAMRDSYGRTISRLAHELAEASAIAAQLQEQTDTNEGQTDDR